MPTPPRLDIRSAHDIVAALSSPDLATRLAVCQAAAARPTHILAYGAAAGVDLVQAFLEAAGNRESLLLRKATLSALVHFDDPRIVELFRSTLLTSSESDVLRLAAKRVALDSTPASRQFLRERLLLERSPLRVRCIASALESALDLSAAEKLRLVMAKVGAAAAVAGWPRDGAEHAACWSEELQGPFALHARRLLQIAGTSGDLLALLPGWSRWANADRAWLVTWGSTLFASVEPPVEVRALLTEALSQPAASVVLAALRWCSACPGTVPAAALMPHVSSANAELRLAALAALPFGALDWWHLARTDSEPSVRALAVDRAPAEGDCCAIAPELAALMDDTDWRVRAAVVRRLSRNGAAAVDTARVWLAHSKPHVRAGALQILLDQRDEHWLSDTLLR